MVDIFFAEPNTIFEVEKATGLDFFSKVPKEEQERLERTISTKAWKGL